MCLFFFFKQKTAYEMRISDWSSDVCSSDLGLQPVRFTPQVQNDLGTVEFLGTRVVNERPELKQWGVGSPAKIDLDAMIIARSKYNSGRRRSEERRVGKEGVSSVDLGGRRSIKKTKKEIPKHKKTNKT